MTAQTRAAVWIDHKEAKIFHVDLDGFDEERLRAPGHRVHRHPKDPSQPHAHPDEQKHFFEEVARTLTSAEQILILGPSTAKAQFVNYLESHGHALSGKWVAVETTDHPTDGQLVAHIRNHFRIPEPRVR